MKTIATKNSIICENSSSSFKYFAWPTVTRLPDGTLAAVSSGFRLKHVCPFGKVVICYSRDEGKSWTKPAIAIDTPLDDRDGGITAFGNGRVILTSFTNSVDFQKAHNDRQWAESKYHGLINTYLEYIDAEAAEEKYLGSTYVISEDGGYTFGDVKLAPVSAPHGPCRLKDGSLFYVGVLKEERKGKNADLPTWNRPLECYHSRDGETWEHVSSINASEIDIDVENKLMCEPYAVCLPSGKLIIQFRLQGERTIEEESPLFTVYQCESCDGGKTLTKPHSIGLEHGSPPHIMRHSSGALIMSYGYRKEPFGQRISISYDEGESWEHDFVLRDDGMREDLGYPSTVERADGSLLTVYYQYPKGKDYSVLMQSIWELPKR